MTLEYIEYNKNFYEVLFHMQQKLLAYILRHMFLECLIPIHHQNFQQSMMIQNHHKDLQQQ